jgi:lysozyme
MKTSEEGIALIKKFEGCKLRAYLDAVDVPTIAYGRTKDVKIGDICTQQQAEDWLEEELVEYEGYVNEAVKVELTQPQFDSLVSWTYNLGPSNLNRSSMLRVLNTSDYDNVPEQIMRWNKAGGRVLPGLVRRREAEAEMFKGNDWSII